MKTRFLYLLTSLLVAFLLVQAWLLMIPKSMPGSASANTGVLFVAPWGNCGATAPCFSDLQQAVQAAKPGDEIRVAAGLYTQTYTFASPAIYLGADAITQVVYITKPLSIYGGFTITDWATSKPFENPTILDGQDQGRTLFIANVENLSLDGFVISGGTAQNDYIGGEHEVAGGGIFAISATISISGSQIQGNHSWGDNGGGVYAANSTLFLINTGITRNSTTFEGAGIYAVSSQLSLENCEISGNNTSTRGGAGGGISISDGLLKVNNSLIQDNGAFSIGGGILAGDSALTITNTVIQNHLSTSGAGISLYNSQSQILSSTIQKNTAMAYYGGGSGGGILIAGGFATIIGSQISQNASTGYGSNHEYDLAGAGIMSVNGDLVLERNRITGNNAIKGGALAYFGEAVLRADNNVFIDNQAYRGSSLYLAGGSAQLTHNTFARNPGLNGSIEIASGSRVSITNTIISGHQIGILASAQTTTTLESILWYANTANISGAGSIALTNAYTGTPAFACDGYHLLAFSAAVDRGIATAVDNDLDGDHRPLGSAPDLGADEFGGFVPDCRYVYLPLIYR